MVLMTEAEGNVNLFGMHIALNAYYSAVQTLSEKLQFLCIYWTRVKGFSTRLRDFVALIAITVRYTYNYALSFVNN